MSIFVRLPKDFLDSLIIIDSFQEIVEVCLFYLIIGSSFYYKKSFETYRRQEIALILSEIEVIYITSFLVLGNTTLKIGGVHGIFILCIIGVLLIFIGKIANMIEFKRILASNVATLKNELYTFFVNFIYVITFILREEIGGFYIALLISTISSILIIYIRYYGIILFYKIKNKMHM